MVKELSGIVLTVYDSCWWTA